MVSSKESDDYINFKSINFIGFMNLDRLICSITQPELWTLSYWKPQRFIPYSCYLSNSSRQGALFWPSSLWDPRWWRLHYQKMSLDVTAKGKEQWIEHWFTLKRPNTSSHYTKQNFDLLNFRGGGNVVIYLHEEESQILMSI